MPDIFLYAINSSLWAKVLSSLVLLVYIWKIGPKKGISVLGEFRWIAIVMLVTDGAQLLVPILWFFPMVQGLAILYYYHRILGEYSPHTRLTPLFWVLGIPAALAGIFAPLL